jgi:AcrR family transcriptional regulator
MTNSKSSGAAMRNAPARGRPNQRRRTQRALIDAVLALCEDGRKPTFAEVAERAMVSRATAYRYFSSVEALISDALFGRAVPPLERLFKPGDDPVEAIGRAAIAVNKTLLDDEVGVHVIVRSFMGTWLDNEPHERPPRPGRRMNYIEPIVGALKVELPPSVRERLRHALSMVMGTEAVLAMRDVAGASVEQALAAGAWAARSLLRQALADAQAARLTRSKSRRAAASSAVPSAK